MPNQTFTLPTEDELNRRLLSADSSYHHVEYLHPIIKQRFSLERAERDIRATMIVLELQSAIEEYAENHFPKNLPPATAIKLMWLRAYITHIVTDRAVRVRALRQISSGYPSNPAP